MKSKLRHSIAALVLCLGILGSFLPVGTARAEEAVPTVANSGFENINPDGTVPGWAPFGSSTSVSVTDSVYNQAYSGAKSVVIQDTDPVKSAGIESDYLSLAGADSFL